MSEHEDGGAGLERRSGGVRDPRLSELAPHEPLEPARFSLAMTPALEHDVQIVRFDGYEALSEIYSFAVEVTGAHADFMLDERVEKVATLTVRHGPYTRAVQGIVSRIEHASGADESVHTVFTIVPELWLLTQHRRFRIYQDLTTPQIVDQVLATAGVYARRVSWRLTNPSAYVQRTYCVQYGESDFDFISRLLEDEGIFFSFDHPLEGRESIVFCDSNQLPPIDEQARVRYHEDSARLFDAEHVTRLGVVVEARPGATALRDYDPLQPRLDLESKQDAGVAADREVYDFPGGYTRRGEGRRRAQIRLEALRARRVLASGEALIVRFQPGRTFALAGHPRGDLDQEYALWRVSHHGRADETTAREGSTTTPSRDGARYRYACTFECTPLDVPIRIAARTQKPRVAGSETAFVVGPAGEEIDVDEMGRIRVQFHWDRDGHMDEHSTCWIRVAQSWAGAGWGAMVVPRIGMEVVVDFLSGDPDRPLVTGCVYNAGTSPPNLLPSEKTKSTFRTNSSPGGNGFNELTFEDLAGSEKIFVHAQRDMEEVVLHDHATTVNHDQSNHVVHDQTESVDVDQTLTVGHNRTQRVGVDETVQIGANQTLSVGGHRTKSVTGNETTTVSGNQAETVRGNEVHTVDGNQTVTIHGHRIRNMNQMEANSVSSGRVSSVGPFDVKVVKGVSATNVLGQYSVTALTGANVIVLESSLAVKPTSVSINAPKKMTIKVGNSVAELEPDKVTLSSGKGATIVLEGANVKITGTNVEIVATGEAKIDGAPIKLNS